MIKRFIFILTVLIILSSNMAVAAESAFPSGFLIGDSDGIHVTSDGKYFIYADDMKPGDTIYKTLTISNNENSTFILTMTADPLNQTGPIELLDKITLRLTFDGSEIYNGRVYGDGGINMIQNALPLGKYSYGDMKIMQIELSLDSNIPLDKFKQKSIAEVRWNFYAVKEAGGTPPKTGEDVNHLLAVLSFIIIVVSVTLLYKHYKTQN